MHACIASARSALGTNAALLLGQAPMAHDGLVADGEGYGALVPLIVSATCRQHLR